MNINRRTKGTMKRATARDVAEYVGCSISTVSLVVNGRHEGRITRDLRMRIEEAVLALDYQPNVSARTLSTQRPSSVALVCPDVRNPFFGDLFHGLSAGIEGRFGIQLRVASSDGGYGIDVVREAQAENLGGLVLANPSPSVLQAFRPSCPTVLVDSPGLDRHHVRVNIDLDGASFQLASHLIDLGHRKVGYIDLHRENDTFARRRIGIESTLRSAGGSLVGILAAEHLTIAAGEKAFIAGWHRWQAAGVTAVIAADDILAYGVISGARSLGLKVPEDLSVAGFNDIPFSAYIDPPLTSVDFHAYDLGMSTALALHNMIAGKEVETTIAKTHLQVRSSTTTPTKSLG